MARHSLAKKYSLILVAIASITFLSVFLIQRNFQMQTDSPSVIGTQGETGAVVRFASVFRPDSLDPLAVDDPLEAAVCALLYDTLYVTKDGTCIPSALVQQETLAEGELTLDLNPDVLFHGGRRIGAEDVKFSLERSVRMEAETAALQAPSLSMLQGWEPFRSGAADSLEGIEIVDDNTIRFRFEGDAGFLIRALCAGRHAVLERRTVERTLRYGQFWRGKIDPLINGTGAYRLAEWDEDRLVLERASDPSFNRFEFRFHEQAESVLLDLQLGRLDGALWDVPEQNQGALPLASREELMLVWQQGPDPLSDVLTRGIRRNSLMQSIGWDEPVRTDERGMLLAQENPESARMIWQARADGEELLRLGLVEDAQTVLAAHDIRKRMQEIDVAVELVLHPDEQALAESLLAEETDAVLVRRFIRSQADATDTAASGLDQAALVRNRFYLSLSSPLSHPVVKALQGRERTP